MRRGSSQQLENFMHAAAVAVAAGVAAHLSEDASGGMFPVIAAVVAFSMGFSFLQLAPGFALGVRDAVQALAAPSRSQMLLLGSGGWGLAVAVTDSRWRWDAPWLYECIEGVGVVLIAASVIGQRLYASKLAPGAVAFLGCLGAAGVGAQSGGLLLTALALAGAFALLVTIPRPTPVAANVVHLHAPRRRTWNDAGPARQGWLMAGLLFSAVPLADIAERLQASGYFPVLLRLP
jgi:hypothetical protein